MRRYDITEVQDRISARTDKKELVLLCSAACAATAQGCEAGGADFLVHYSCSEARLQGKGSMYGCLNERDYNPSNFSVLPEFQGVQIPVIAGVNPVKLDIGADEYLAKLKRHGYSGVICFPSASMRGDSMDVEMDVYRRAVGQGLFCMAFAFSAQEASQLYRCGVNALIYHFGMSPDVRKLPLDAACKRVDEICGLWCERPVFLHGGPTIDPGDVVYLTEHSMACGVLNGSTADEMPVTKAAQAMLKNKTGRGCAIVRAANGVQAKAAAANGADWLSVHGVEQYLSVTEAAGSVPVLAEIGWDGKRPDWNHLRQKGISGVSVRFQAVQRNDEPGENTIEKRLSLLKEAKSEGFSSFATVSSFEELVAAKAAGLNGAIHTETAEVILFPSEDRGFFYTNEFTELIFNQSKEMTQRFRTI